jgi:hypothetical protein
LINVPAILVNVRIGQSKVIKLHNSLLNLVGISIEVIQTKIEKCGSLHIPMSVLFIFEARVCHKFSRN